MSEIFMIVPSVCGVQTRGLISRSLAADGPNGKEKKDVAVIETRASDRGPFSFL